VSRSTSPRRPGEARGGVAGRIRLGLVLSAAVLSLGACASQPYEPDRATRPYPRSLHATDPPQDIQVFREGRRLRLVNATTRSYRDAELWVNQRYVMDLPTLEAGATVIVNMGELWDRWGGRPSAGGFLRRNAPTPVRTAEIQIGDSTPLIGLIVIRSESADIL